MKIANEQRLIHFTKDADLCLSKLTNRVQTFRTTHGGFKPYGFWFSIEGNGDGWKDWCESEHFRPESLTYAYEVTLAPKNNILWIKNAEALDAFTGEFSQEALKRSLRTIDWAAVAERWDGIIIAPYLWERRMAEHTSWYYGWDCASGCIWNVRAIAGLVYENHT